MRIPQVLLLASTAACLLAVQLAAGEPYATNQRNLPCYRLPIKVRPTNYDLDLKFPSLDSDVYEGQVDIAVEFLKSYATTFKDLDLQDVPCVKHHHEDTIVLHAGRELEIQDIKVKTSITKMVPISCFPFCKPKKKSSIINEVEAEIEELIRDDAKQMIGIRLKQASPDGTPGRVSIKFKGRMRHDKRGVYVSTYNDGERVFKHIVTQFQPTDARTVFPCFDEPRFRANFSVTVTHPRDLDAYGNTEVEEAWDEGDLTVTRFATTPEMPLHMVAFTIGKFDAPLRTISVSEVGESKGKRRWIRVITAPGKRETGRFALDVARKSLEWFERNIEYAYPLDKLDVIAIADHDKDNTESWGLVFVRDTLLWIDDETKPDTKVTTAVNIAQVVVHQWFGNLISVNWWSELWITEGVAAQVALSFVEDEYDFQSEFFVRLSLLSGVLQADQTGNLHPLRPSEDDLQTSDQIYGIFDNLEFMKSASMAQMISESYNFPDARKYFDDLKVLVRDHAYKTVNFREYKRVISKMTKSGEIIYREDIDNLVESFTTYTGVPVVNCQFDAIKNTLNVHLETFANASRDLVRIPASRHPLTIMVAFFWRNRWSKYLTPPKHTTDRRGEALRLSAPEYMELTNPASGAFVKVDYMPSIATYYRTRYSDELYEQLQGPIKRHALGPMDRLQILDDANSLAQAGLIKPERFKSLLESYVNEDHPAVVLAVLTATNTYSGLSPEDAASLQSGKAISAIFEKYGFAVSGDEDLITQRARQVVLKTLIQQGNEQVMAAALEAFDEARGKVALFLREPVYTAAVLSGSSERLHQLLRHLSQTKSYEEQIRLVSALTLSKDKEVLAKVKSWLESSGLKAETMKPFLDTISAVLPH